MAAPNPNGQRLLDPHRPSALDLFHSRHPDEDDAQAPPTPPYRRDASASQEVITRAMPPDYRSEMNVSRDRLDDHYDDEKSAYPREKEPLDASSSRKTSGDDQTSGPARGVRYPDLEGHGTLSNIPTRSNTRNFEPGHSRAPSIAASDVEDYDDEEYDWSDEDDLVDQEAKFEKKMGIDNRKKKGWSFTRFLTFFFSTLIGSVLLSAALVAVPVLLRIFWLKPDPTDRHRYIMDNIQAWFFWAAANVTISWWLASIIDVLPHILTLILDVVWGDVSEAMKSRIELYNTGKGWIKPPFYGGCAWVAWVILFNGVFDLYDPAHESASPAPYTPRVYQGIKFLFFLVLVVSIEKMLVQVIAFSFHRTAYQERLDAVANATHVIDHLKDYRPKRRTAPAGFASGRKTPPILSAWSTPVPDHTEGGDYLAHGQQRSRFSSEPAAMEEGFAADNDSDSDARNGKNKGKDKKRVSKGWFGSKGKKNRSSIALHDTSMESGSGSGHTYPPAHSTSGARTPLRKRSDERDDGPDAVIFTAAKALKTVVLHDARNMRSDKTDDDDALGFKISSAHEAKKLARDLYFAFKTDRKRTYLVPSDFYPAYPNSQDDAKEAFKVFDKNDNGDITRAEMKTAVMKVYKERRFLARSLRDVSAAVNTLDGLMLCAAMVVLFFISLSIFGVSIGSSISSIYTIFIAASFIFKNAASNAFDAIMFLFVTHPFDTGDRCFIGDENLVVKKMGLFATTFTRADGTQTYYFNSMLSTKFINNVRRSGNMFEGLEMQVNWRTPLKKFDLLEQCLNEWIQSDEKRWYVPGASVMLQRIEFQRNLELTIGIGHNGTWQDWGLRLARKTAFHAAVQFYCRQLGITYAESPQPIVFTDPTQTHPFLDDLGDDLVFGDEAAAGGIPSSPMSLRHHQQEPTSATTNTAATTVVSEHVKPLLGFVAPKDGKSQLRLRKSRVKKHMGAGVD